MNPSRTIPLWSHRAPGAHGTHLGLDMPTLKALLPQDHRSRSRAAMIICPGGGYWELMSDYEGLDYALWLNQLGIAAFVLTYRLACNGYHHPAITSDITRAIRFLRHHAGVWGIDPSRIGVMGSSAGGHLASYAATHFSAASPQAGDPVDRHSSRPDLAVLCYPLISLRICSVENLTGPAPSPELVRELSSELNVTSLTPPCFLWHTQDDPVVSVDHSLVFAEALRSNLVPFSLNIYPSGPHGLGLGVHGYDPDIPQNLHPWTGELHAWLQHQGFIGIEAGSVSPPITAAFANEIFSHRE